MEKNRRKRSRVDTEFAVTLRVGDRNIPVSTVNISLKGMLFETNERLELGRECEVHMALSEGVDIFTESKVVRSDGEKTAVDFLTMDELSFHHLREIVRLYADDADEIDHELATPAFDE